MESEEVFPQQRSNYIVVVRRAGEINDVWKLKDALINFVKSSNGWRITTNNNSNFFVSGDVEIWNISDEQAELWGMYNPYHRHQSKETYKELFIKDAPPPPPPPPVKVKKKFPRWPYKITWDW